MKRKLNLLIISLFMCLICAQVYAQESKEVTPLKSQQFWETMYIGAGINVHGEPSSEFNSFKNSIGGGANLRIGKNVTPIFGVETEFNFGIPNGNEQCSEGFKFINLGMNFLTNMNNVFHKYKGKPDKFEVVPYAGIGWERFLHRTRYNLSSDIYSKFGVNLNLNITEHIQLHATPYAQFRMTNSNKELKYDSPQFNVHNLRVGVNVGFIYKFGNFKYSKLKYTQEDYDNINDLVNKQRTVNKQMTDKYNKLLKENNRLSNELVDINNKKVPVEVTYNVMPTIQFTIGKTDIEPSQFAALEQIVKFMKKNKDVNISIVGHADAETGSPERNDYLAEQRAIQVKNALVELGIDKSRLYSIGDADQLFDRNDSNRVVVFEEK